MSMFTGFDISASGLTAQRLRMDVVAENVANAGTTRTGDGDVYRRKVVNFEEKDSQTSFSRVLNKSIDNYSGKGVKVTSVFEDTWNDTTLVYEPGHPDANADGYVEYPNVNIVEEMTDLIDASRSYEANATAFEASKSMAMKGLSMIQ